MRCFDDGVEVLLQKRRKEVKTMKTLYEVMDGSGEDEEKLKRAGEILKAGGLVAFPTETVYGLGGDALNP